MAAKELMTQVKLQVPAGSANPAPPVGPALGQQCGALHQLAGSKSGKRMCDSGGGEGSFGWKPEVAGSNSGSSKSGIDGGATW